MERIKVLELFGGIGAPRKALENLLGEEALKFIDYVEIDPKPLEGYNRLYSHAKRVESVIGYNLKPDFLIHGSPCQDFSVAGKGIGGYQGSGTRSSLLWETVRIISEMSEWKPKVVIWENVKGVLNKNNIAVFDKYVKAMDDMGYSSTHKVLNSKDFGIPQSRNRVFVVSILESAKYTFDFDNLERRPMLPLKSFLEKDVDKSYFVKQNSMIKAVEQNKIKIVGNRVETITTKQWRWNNAGVIKVPISTFNQENYTICTFVGGVAVPTITASGANSRIKIYVPKEHDDLPVFELEDGKLYNLRILTQKEAWLLMGFTAEDFKRVEGMPKTALYHMAGNSIVVQVLEAIFKELLNI